MSEHEGTGRSEPHGVVENGLIEPNVPHVGALVAVQPVLVGSGVLLVAAGVIGWRRLLALQRAGLAPIRERRGAPLGVRGRHRG